jgi:septation ring formation regulator EzrA
MLTFIGIVVWTVLCVAAGILIEKKNSAKIDPVVNQAKTKTGL